MAAASATSLSATFSSLSLNSHRRKTVLFSFHHFPLNTPQIPVPIPLLSKQLQKLSPHRVNSSDEDNPFVDALEPEETSTFDFSEVSENYTPMPFFDNEPPETEEEIAAAYEELYGTPYSEESSLSASGFLSTREKPKLRDGLEERLVQVRRVTKVVKGGKQLNFRAMIIVGDKNGNVGIGMGKAAEVPDAVEKAGIDARRNIIAVPMTKYKTFPHRADGKYGAAKVMLRPAAPGTGVLAGGAVRVVLEMAGLQNALGKQLGSNNALNNAKATVAAIQKMRLFSEVAEERGIPMQQLWS